MRRTLLIAVLGTAFFLGAAVACLFLAQSYGDSIAPLYTQMLPRTGQAVSTVVGDDANVLAGYPPTNRMVDLGNNIVYDRACGIWRVKNPAKIIPGTGLTILEANNAWATSTAYAVGDLVSDANGSQSTFATITEANASVVSVLKLGNLRGLQSGDTVLFSSFVDANCWGSLNATTRYVKVIDSAAKTVSLFSDSKCGTDVDTTTFGTFLGEGNLVQVKYYACATAHTSAAFITDITAAKWVLTPWVASAANLTTPRAWDWADGVAACNALSYGGRTGYSATNKLGWRMPNALEFVTEQAAALTSSQYIVPPLACRTTDSWQYWTATSKIADATQAMSFSYNTYMVVGHYAKGLTFYVRPVAGGVP